MWPLGTSSIVKGQEKGHECSVRVELSDGSQQTALYFGRMAVDLEANCMQWRQNVRRSTMVAPVRIADSD